MPQNKDMCLTTIKAAASNFQVMGLPRKRNYAGRWDVLIDKSTKCLNRMLEIASKKKRNFILDQVQGVLPSQ